ncbi:hypothetical protein [Streptomyces sp. NBC_00503]|uniref:hypothetical protein n=1 Tax=Streptomyces sp. NBC_00503 TaxID=2903659 RepID=UPI002E813241|nr:hypothetical protein [Streptomyces sp. NBC_00503]WUD85268.1 hypothetical protein OG490_34495 [Streptomyces sp. NBC_00503]
MPLKTRRARALMLWGLVVALLAFTGLCFYQGKTPALYPESSWGPRRSEAIEGGGTAYVRVNSWAHAAQADLQYGKAAGLSLNAYGETVHGVTPLGGISFTLTPDGRLTAKQ